jgi:rubrerythrin
MVTGDVPTDPDAESTYECLDCGRVVEAASHPGRCPACGSELRNRETPLE